MSEPTLTGMRYIESGEPVRLGDMYVDEDNDVWYVVGGRYPALNKPEGRLYARLGSMTGPFKEFKPSALGAEWPKKEA